MPAPRNYFEPVHLRLESSSRCRLRCPACLRPADGPVGAGYLRAYDFAAFAERHPERIDIEISNWGEPFLNPELPAILRIARQRGLRLRADNGTTLNDVGPDVLELLVTSEFESLHVSIDGTSQKTYAAYRRGGSLERVLANLAALNARKQAHGTAKPRLVWQFIAFGHNEHEIDAARAQADRLGMLFYLKLNYSTVYAPLNHPERLRRELGVASRDEYERMHGRPYTRPCTQLRSEPQVNWDGKLLGCCRNVWCDFGNVFTNGLAACMASPRYRRLMAVVAGQAPATAEFPCSRCPVYDRMRLTGSFLT
jgi:MoaA/NifB/PqqE/SkfB family radical SAM enzyme